jgi:hypothetical protein
LRGAGTILRSRTLELFIERANSFRITRIVEALPSNNTHCCSSLVQHCACIPSVQVQSGRSVPARPRYSFLQEHLIQWDRRLRNCTPKSLFAVLALTINLALFIWSSDRVPFVDRAILHDLMVTFPRDQVSLTDCKLLQPELILSGSEEMFA